MPILFDREPFQACRRRGAGPGERETGLWLHCAAPGAGGRLWAHEDPICLDCPGLIRAGPTAQRPEPLQFHGVPLGKPVAVFEDCSIGKPLLGRKGAKKLIVRVCYPLLLLGVS
jgi:hypothetical protein